MASMELVCRRREGEKEVGRGGRGEVGEKDRREGEERRGNKEVRLGK